MTHKFVYGLAWQRKFPDIDKPVTTIDFRSTKKSIIAWKYFLKHVGVKKISKIQKIAFPIIWEK